MGQSRPPFSLFSSYSHCNNNNSFNCNNINWRKHRWFALESNPGPHDGRRRWNHGAMAAAISQYSFFLGGGSFPASFFFIFVFSIQLTVKMFNLNFCRSRDSNRGPLDSEATALPTEPRPLPSIFSLSLAYVYLILSFSLSHPFSYGLVPIFMELSS